MLTNHTLDSYFMNWWIYLLNRKIQ